jgi:hypothetical protein
VGLSLCVGAPIDVYTEGHAQTVASLLQARFGLSLPRQPLIRKMASVFPAFALGGGYRSEEMGASWVEALQAFASSTLGEARTPQLLACDAWNSVFLPREMAPEELKLGPSGPPRVEGPETQVKEILKAFFETLPAGGDEILRCASLPALMRELRLLGEAANLPGNDVQARELLRRYRRDAAIDDPHLQMYAWFQICAATAQCKGAGLWLVK